MAGRVASESSCWSYFRWVPVITPAVKADSCEVDYSLLQSRIIKVVLAAIALVVAALVVASVFPPAAFLVEVAISLVLCVPPCLMVLDSWVANRAANAKAVNQYLDMDHPSQGATLRIQHHLGAAKLLVSKGGNVNKRNEQGEHLLGYLPDLDVFKHLVDHGINLKDVDRYGIPLFERIVEASDPAFLKYVLDQKKVTADDFDRSQQVSLWLHLGNQKAGPLLAQHGFDVNIRDEQGRTPLLKLVYMLSNRFSYGAGHRLSPAVHVRTLLELGANRDLTVAVGGEQKTAMQINTDASVRAVLADHNIGLNVGGKG